MLGLRDLWTLTQATQELAPAAQGRRGRTGIRSPWSSSHLESVVWSDIFGGAAPAPVSRAEAMRVPAIARARHLLCSSIAGMPLRVLTQDGSTPEQPTWTYRTDSSTVPPQLRMAWTVDDLIFTGYSLWAVRRGAEHQVLDATRLPLEEWAFDGTGQILAYGEPVAADAVILFVGWHEGICDFGQDTIRTAKRLEATAATRADSPIPAVELHQTDDVQLDDDEIDGLIEDYVKARRDPNGAVVYTPHNVELKIHGTLATELLVQARNASAIDCARDIGVPASMIDASNVNASLQYETVQGRNLEFRDYSLALYTGPIESRLSLDDVVPRGQRVRFDTSALTGIPAPTGPLTED